MSCGIFVCLLVSTCVVWLAESSPLIRVPDIIRNTAEHEVHDLDQFHDELSELKRVTRQGGPLGMLGGANGNMNIPDMLNLARTVLTYLESAQGNGGFNSNAGGYDANTGGYDVNTGGYDVNAGGYDVVNGGYDVNNGGYVGENVGGDVTRNELSRIRRRRQ